MKITALIMAGGKGERFWPKSRQSLPKQFLSLTDDGKTMIQLTVERISMIVDIEDVFVVTNKSYKDLVLEQLAGIPEVNVLCEPVGRNTAPCIGLGAAHISKKYEDAVMLVLPSDHLIKDVDSYIETIKEAVSLAEKGRNIVTLGIMPNYPEIGYGYIQIDKADKTGNASPVLRFVEKPSLEVAKTYLASGEYFWNSGMFVWKTSTILDSIERFMPDIYEGVLTIREAVGTAEYQEVLDKVFVGFRSESIDYGIMEKASDVFTIPGMFGWDDVGSWLAIERIREVDKHANNITGNVVIYNTKNCIIEAGDKLIATVGIDDLVIVDTNDALLICSKETTGDIKKVLELIKEKGYTDNL